MITDSLIASASAANFDEKWKILEDVVKILPNLSLHTVAIAPFLERAEQDASMLNFVHPSRGGFQLVVSGYANDVNGEVKYIVREPINSSSETEAYLNGVELSIQFLIEEANVMEGEITIILYNKEMVEWLNGKVDTNWSSRFVRNKVIKLRSDFSGIKFKFLQVKEFKKKETWTQMMRTPNSA
ncbi:hypothetical protein PIB30_009644 [Stylosanthes scabra]|uniref:RNase H type-1 domain-containing protein n=1 Tax=Stylosanthes scabra TaxID=79078 RepID=A0ABU6T740_9FABA|nr:hypothetical protein [Stylosanthes scabra]